MHLLPCVPSSQINIKFNNLGTDTKTETDSERDLHQEDRHKTLLHRSILNSITWAQRQTVKETCIRETDTRQTT